MDDKRFTALTLNLKRHFTYAAHAVNALVLIQIERHFTVHMGFIIQEAATEFINALVRLWNTLITSLGVAGTLGVALFIVIASAGIKRYNDVRRDRDAKEALDEKEKSIQRLNEENRMWRALFLKDKCGMSAEEINRLVLKNEFPDAPAARKALEGEATHTPGKKSNGRKR